MKDKTITPLQILSLALPNSLFSLVCCWLLSLIHSEFSKVFIEYNVELPAVTKLVLSIPLFCYYLLFILVTLFVLKKQLANPTHTLKISFYFAISTIAFIVLFIMAMYLPVSQVVS